MEEEGDCGFGGGINVTAYEFYVYDGEDEAHLIGVLPERRNNAARITSKSVKEWCMLVLGSKSEIDFNHLYFKRIKIK